MPRLNWVLRIVCVGYIVFLTLLLLTKDPSHLFGVEGELPWVLRAMLPLAHAISFLGLSVLALIARWPVPRWSIVLALLVYGGMTEVFQGFVPHRTPEWADWLQDVAGIAVGSACCWGLAVCLGGLLPRRERQDEALEAVSSVELSVTRRLLQRSGASERSWWS